MELPILQYLPLPDDARRIVLQFLRKHHPTAVMIKELVFETGADVFEDGADYTCLTVWGDTLCLTGPQILVGPGIEDDGLPLTFPYPAGPSVLHFFYDRYGETFDTDELYERRMTIYANTLRMERGLHIQMEPFFGPVE